MSDIKNNKLENSTDLQHVKKHNKHDCCHHHEHNHEHVHDHADCCCEHPHHNHSESSDEHDHKHIHHNEYDHKHKNEYYTCCFGILTDIYCTQGRYEHKEVFIKSISSKNTFDSFPYYLIARWHVGGKEVGFNIIYVATG